VYITPLLPVLLLVLLLLLVLVPALLRSSAALQQQFERLAGQRGLGHRSTVYTYSSGEPRRLLCAHTQDNAQPPLGPLDVAQFGGGAATLWFPAGGTYALLPARLPCQGTWPVESLAFEVGAFHGCVVGIRIRRLSWVRCWYSN
jgi:hypothetical protein